MHSSLFVFALAAGLARAADPAPVTNDNPVGTVYKAEMPSVNSSSIQGYVSAMGNTNGTGVIWSIDLTNIPTAGGPFAYHVHVDPVPADGNCTGAGAHLDPQVRGEDPPCDPAQGLNSCQVGDLAGKHGKITSDPWQAVYLDLYTSTTPGSPAFVGNRSIVIHDAAKNRIACANITMLSFSSSPSACSSYPSGATEPSEATGGSTQTEKQTTATESAAAGGDDVPTGAAPGGYQKVSSAAGAAVAIAALFAVAL